MSPNLQGIDDSRLFTLRILQDLDRKAAANRTAGDSSLGNQNMEWSILWIVSIAVVAMLLMKRAASASPEVLRKHVQEGALVIDVRSPEEFRKGHLPGAVNIPLNELRNRVQRLAPDPNKVLLLHCQSGMRSLNGLRQLQRLGYKNVFNLGSYRRAKQIVGGKA